MYVRTSFYSRDSLGVAHGYVTRFFTFAAKRKESYGFHSYDLFVAKHYSSYELSCNLHVCIFHKGVWVLSRNSSICARVKSLSTLGVATLQPLFEKIQVETHFDRRRSASLLAYVLPLSV